MRTLLPMLLLLPFAAPVRAQSKPDTLHSAEKASAAKTWTFGVSSGAISFGDGGHERGVSAAVGISLPHGFSLSANPTYAWAQAAPSIIAMTGQKVHSKPVQGLADLPVGIGFSHSLPGDWSPGFDVSLGATLPTGDTTAVGAGKMSLGVSLDVWLEPVDGWTLNAGTGHSLSNDYASALGTIAPTTVSLGLAHDVGSVSLNVGYSTELGTIPVGTTHSQNILGGISWPMGKETTLSVDGSVGRADGAQSWALSVGIGTTIAAVGQVSPFAAARRLAGALGKGRSMGKSRSTAAKTGKKKG
jgi:hypothetical protein